ncbi:HTH-type transcriptional regulator LrpA1 [Halodesulfurarchaeum sp.]|uniref:HTH-type transcriptional regulator LrpA1 n=1 Tax=Halodesulfurarchaeum sp. TaxID=1980530 RepID=UPI002FC3B399
MNEESTADRILEVLESDAQASYGEIAEQVGVSKPTVRKYVSQLEEQGVIVGYSAEVDPKKLSSTSIAFVGFDVKSERYVDAIQELKALESLRTLYSSSGDHMLMAEMRAEDGDTLARIIQDEVMTIEGIEEAHPTFLQERLK